MFGGTPDRLANAFALALDAVHETSRPDEFGGEQAESEEDSDPSRGGGDDHDQSGEQQRESGNDAEDTANLFDIAEEHRNFLAGKAHSFRDELGKPKNHADDYYRWILSLWKKGAEGGRKRY